MNRIVHIALKVDNLERTTQFYEKVIGFKESKTEKVRDHTSRHLSDGAIDLSIMQYDAETESAESKAAGEGPCIHHKLGRKLSMQDLRAHRQLVVRESSPRRATPLTMEATQRWTVSNLATSIEAARSGHGFAWLPEERIREELKAGTLKALPLREGGERYAELYLIFADREHAGPATLRLAEIIREAVASECKKSAVPARGPARKRARGAALMKTAR